MTDISEKILLSHPDMREYYQLRYKIYKLLNLDFDLFLTEDICNYNNIIYNKTYKHYIPEEYKNSSMDLSNYIVRIINNHHRFELLVVNKNISNILYPHDLRILCTIFSKKPFTQKQLDIVNHMYQIEDESNSDYTPDPIHINYIINIVSNLYRQSF